MSANGLHILLADDDLLSREYLTEALASTGAQVTACDDGASAIKHLKKTNYDCVFTDYRMPRKGGMEVLRFAKEQDASLPVVLVTAYGTVDVAIEALREGVDDVLMKPVDVEQIELVLARLKERKRLIAENEYLRSESSAGTAMICLSPAMRAVDALIDRIAGTDVTVLITGESGTGKEVVASELHRRSGRKGPFVKVNCAAIPESLMESEFFGHEAGSFTGATGTKIGKFELADQGTLLLDEIGEIALPLQAKLLRVLEDGMVQRVGASTATHVDVRVIASTNRSLEQMVKEGSFRQDLYYRIEVMPVALAPLRERPEDLKALAEYFLEQEAKRQGTAPLSIGAAASRILEDYDWPGNVRELRNLMQRASILCEGGELEALKLQAWTRSSAERDYVIPRMEQGAEQGDVDLHESASVELGIDAFVGKALRDVEDALILATFEAENGNRSNTARVLGISPRTLYNRLQQLEPSPS